MNREQCLEKAKQCVNGERDREYGSPEDNFKKIADLWTTYKGVSFTPVDVAMMMSLLKIARIAGTSPTDDSFVDLAGYAACGCEIFDKTKTEQQTARLIQTIQTKEDTEELIKNLQTNTRTEHQTFQNRKLQQHSL